MTAPEQHLMAPDRDDLEIMVCQAGCGRRIRLYAPGKAVELDSGDTTAVHVGGLIEAATTVQR